MLAVAVPWLATVFKMGIVFPMTPVAGPVREESDRSVKGTGVLTALPVNAMFAGLLRFKALWVMARVPEDRPAPAGENRTIKEVDCPGFREKAVTPATREKGGDSSPTAPVRTPDELALFLMVINLSEF